jgi:hypothetical protein
MSRSRQVGADLVAAIEEEELDEGISVRHSGRMTGLVVPGVGCAA